MSNTEIDNLPSILFLGSQMTVAGAQHILLAQARWFHERGHRVVVAFFYDLDGLHNKWQGEAPFKVINLDAWQKVGGLKNGFRLTSGLIRLNALLWREKFSVVETFTHHANILGLPLAWLARVPSRIASHHGTVDEFPDWLERIHRMIINYGIATDMVAVSEQVRQQAINQERIHPDRITVITNGINIPFETRISEKEKDLLRHSIKVNQDEFLFLTVGRLRKQKGHTYLLDAIPEVLASFPNTVFAFAGEGHLREELESRVKELRITDSVRFLAIRSDIPNLLQVADGFVLSSLWEGLPVALLEAMAAGLPVVATKVEGVEDVIFDSYNGLLIPPADSGALSQAIISLLSNEELRIRLGNAGKALVKEKYTIDRMCEQYEVLFQHSLKSNQ